jgi:hypothetical protein
MRLRALADDPDLRRSLGERARGGWAGRLDGRHMVAALAGLS